MREDERARAIAPLHRAGQWCFLRVEAAFNAAFGDRRNPFYHLGEIAFFLFWVVAASGLYLYAFFETSVVDAHASVQRLTQDQWWLGGLMRSLHRYASDAMVLTMLLHLLRHFCFDRYRGFRAFSWVTGVALLWLVYISGMNGFMLPWDRLAQFVVIASAELLDWLPLFQGRLVRNFLFDGSVNDRLFSLFSFMHIGVPLVLLLFMWIHVQRVPRASTWPARAIWIPLLGTLVALSLVAPVISMAPADLSTAGDALPFDWFYLASFALQYQWSTALVWTLLAGTSALLLALPWLPPKRLGRAAHRVTLYPGSHEVQARAGESLLEAGLRAGVAIAYECRNGGCGVCKGTLLQGRVEHGTYQKAALSDAERAQGKVLLCCAVALEDVALEYPVPAAVDAAATVRLNVSVAGMQRVSDDVMILRLRWPPGRMMHYRAGQYFNVILPDGARRAYSFAAAPDGAEEFEVHVRWIPSGRFSTHVFTTMKEADVLPVEGPFGRYVLQDAQRPLIFVAGATGFAPVKSLLEEAFRQQLSRPLLLYWGVRRRADLYAHELALAWTRAHANFRYVPVLSEPSPEDAWTGRTGLVHEALVADYPELAGFELYACGSATMVENIRPVLLAHGLSENLCFSDSL